MSITQNACGCGSTTMTGDAGAAPCSCGCCGTEPVAPATREERVAELRALRDNIDQELAELDRV